MEWRTVFIAAALLTWAGTGGCVQQVDTSARSSGGNTSPASGAGHDHGHDHGHEHAAGPHGGHIIELGEEEYHAEWKHDDETGTVTIFVLDGEMKNEVPISASEITITTQVGDNTKEYALAASNASEGDSPKASQFTIEDKSLVVALQAAGHEGTSATLKLDVNGKSYSAPIQHDHGDDHGHKH